MGVYVQLDCLDCETKLEFGKPIWRDRRLTLRLFSEKDLDWIDDVRCWHALQAFLFKHRDHRLVFRKDDAAAAQDVPNHEEFDDLRELYTKGVPYE